MDSKAAQKNIFYNFLTKIVAMVCYFGLDIIAARLLGYVLFDEWNYVYSIIVICNWIFRFGVDSSCRVYIAKSEGDLEKQRDYFEQGVRLQVVVSISLAVILVGLVGFGAGYLGYPQKYPHLKGLLISGLVYSAFYAVLCCIKESFIGMSSFKKLFIVTSVEFVGYIVIGICGMKAAGSYGLACGYALSALLAIIVGTKQLPFSWKFRIRKQNPYAGEIIRYAIPLLIGNIGGMVATEMDTFILGTLHKGEVGIYSVAKNLISKATNIPLAICVAVMVQFAVIENETIKEKCRSFWKILGGNFLFLLTVAFMMCILLPIFIPIFYGQQYRSSIKVLILLIPYFVLYSMTIFLTNFLNYQKKVITVTVATFVMVLFNLVLNFLLVPRYGAGGAAVATTISAVPFTLILLIDTLRFWKRKMKKS